MFQGSGTYAVEAVIQTSTPRTGARYTARKDFVSISQINYLVLAILIEVYYLHFKKVVKVKTEPSIIVINI